MWYVYMLECSDKSLYTGITTDLQRRLIQHNLGVGSKYVRSRLPPGLFKSDFGSKWSKFLFMIPGSKEA